MDHDSIVKKHAENIMQRVNDTYPRTLNIDVLVDEIGKAIKEATRQQSWPPHVAFGTLQTMLEQIDSARREANGGCPDHADIIPWGRCRVTSSHDRSRKLLDNQLANYGKPE